MGALFSTNEKYNPKYSLKDYTKQRPGVNVYKIHNNMVYWKGERVEGARGSSFIDLNDGYGKNKNNVFYKGHKIKTSDHKSFVNLNNNYAKDSINVYYKGNIIRKTNSKSFKTSGKRHSL